MGKRSRTARKPNAAAIAQTKSYPRFQDVQEPVGNFVILKGSHWGKHCAEEDKDKDYRCVVLEYSACQVMGGFAGQGYRIADKGTDGQGPEGEPFWLRYPNPFLEAWHARVDADKHAQAESEAESETTDDDEDKTKPAIYGYLSRDPVAEEVIQPPKKSAGKVKRTFRCEVQHDGGICGKLVYITGAITSNAISHLITKAENGCPYHAAALQDIRKQSKRYAVDKNGKAIKKYPFDLNFPHHVDYVWMLCDGVVSQNTRTRPSFRKYVAEIDTQIEHPHHRTQHAIADAIKALQTAERRTRLKKYIMAFKNNKCLSAQLDLYTDTNNKFRTVYAGLSVCSTKVTDKELQVVTDCISLREFPFTAHTGESISKWFSDCLTDEQLPQSTFLSVTPDGDASGHCALARTDVAPHVNTCGQHQLHIGVTESVQGRENPEGKAVCTAYSRVDQLAVQAVAVKDSIIEQQEAMGIPTHKILGCLGNKGKTRWGALKDRFERNNMIRIALDSAVMEHKKKNRGRKVLAIEEEVTGGGSQIRELEATEVGVTPDQWEDGLQLEAHMEYAHSIKNIIEKVPTLTGAQSLQYIKDLHDQCHMKRAVPMKPFPASLALKHRKRKAIEMVSEGSWGVPLQKARKILASELRVRFLGNSISELTLLISILTQAACRHRRARASFRRPTGGFVHVQICACGACVATGAGQTSESLLSNVPP